MEPIQAQMAVTGSPSLNAGAKVEEYYIGPENHGVRFSDASGTAYRILRIDNTVEKFTVEKYLTIPKRTSCSAKTAM